MVAIRAIGGKALRTGVTCSDKKRAHGLDLPGRLANVSRPPERGKLTPGGLIFGILGGLESKRVSLMRLVFRVSAPALGAWKPASRSHSVGEDASVSSWL